MHKHQEAEELVTYMQLSAVSFFGQLPDLPAAGEDPRLVCFVWTERLGLRCKHFNNNAVEDVGGLSLVLFIFLCVRLS